MKSCVERFSAGLADLINFLHNAERESALIASLLRAPRATPLHAREQSLLGEIAKAGTGKRQYIYAVAIVSLYGLLERFVDSALETYVEMLSAIVGRYDGLPQAIRDNHLSVSIELLKALSEDRYRGDTTISDVVANLHSCISQSATFRVNGAAFVLHRGNLKLEKIAAFLTSLGVDARLRKILLMPAFECFFAAADPPRKVRSIQDQDLVFLLSPINDLVERRNAISHGVIDDIENVDLLLTRCDFVAAFVHALYEILEEALLSIEVSGNSAQSLGRPVAVYGGRIVCFESTNCHIAVGDRIVAATGDNLLPYRWGKVIKLEVDKKPHAELKITEKTGFGVEVEFRARDNHDYYLLKAAP